MIGAIIGDIAGSRFEWNNYKSKKIKLFHKRCKPTDDSIMSLAIAKAILESAGDFTDLSAGAVSCMQKLGRIYKNAGYGGNFYRWIFADDPQPYNSFGNGSAMRVGPCGYAARSFEERYPSKAVDEDGEGSGTIFDVLDEVADVRREH